METLSIGQSVRITSTGTLGTVRSIRKDAQGRPLVVMVTTGPGMFDHVSPFAWEIESV